MKQIACDRCGFISKDPEDFFAGRGDGGYWVLCGACWVSAPLDGTGD